MDVLKLTCRRLATKSHRALRNETFRLQRSNDRPSLIELTPLSPTNQAALAHFDKYYTQIYGPSSWCAMRAALLCPSTKVAVLNRFSARFHDHGRFNGCVDLIQHLSSNHHMATRSEFTGSVAVDAQEAASHENSRDGVTSSSDAPKEQDETEAPPIARRQFLSRDKFGSLDPNNLSEFVPVTELIGESEYYTRPVDEEFTFDVAQHADESLNQQQEFEVLEDPVELPENLRVMCSRRNNRTQYLGSPRYVDGQFDFYPIDLASIIPVLALNLRPGDSLLDLCAAPGGKSVVALQTMLLDRLLCVDNAHSRLARLQQVLTTHGPTGLPFPKINAIHDSQLADFVRTELMNQTSSTSVDTVAAEEQLFSKVMVDVPCSTDRHALSSDSGSVFSRGRAKARMALPATQSILLRRAMNLCRPGGTVVYSTCTLSPAQNHLVVESCLHHVNRADGGKRFALVDLRPLARLFQASQPVLGLRIVTVSSSTRSDIPIGLLTIPAVSANYGPAFVAKLRRVA